jgi:hypothetical protein
MDNEQIKVAFSRVKQDILSLNNNLNLLKQEILELKSIINDFANNSFNSFLKTQRVISTDRQTDSREIEGLKSPNNFFSIGNKGGPTDRQINRQTDRQTPNFTPLSLNERKNPSKELLSANNLIDSLDKVKNDLKSKFKQLTSQEMLVFSTIYQFEDLDSKKATYKEISLKLNLSESSIRDYVQKMLNKKIPIIKHKLNNKLVILSISNDLRKITNLASILKLREL